MFDYAAGVWDTARGDSTCLENRHEISFSPDRSAMVLTFEGPLDSLSNDPNVRYRILAHGHGILDELPYVVRASMNGETRTTEAGELVIWDLVMATPNRYHWHRTDWPDLGVTNAVIRCAGRRPLEMWRPTGSPSGQTIASSLPSPGEARRDGGMDEGRSPDESSIGPLKHRRLEPLAAAALLRVEER